MTTCRVYPPPLCMNKKNILIQCHNLLITKKMGEKLDTVTYAQFKTVCIIGYFWKHTFHIQIIKKKYDKRYLGVEKIEDENENNG